MYVEWMINVFWINGGCMLNGILWMFINGNGEWVYGEWYVNVMLM